MDSQPRPGLLGWVTPRDARAEEAVQTSAGRRRHGQPETARLVDNMRCRAEAAFPPLVEEIGFQRVGVLGFGVQLAVEQEHHLALIVAAKSEKVRGFAVR